MTAALNDSGVTGMIVLGHIGDHGADGVVLERRIGSGSGVRRVGCGSGEDGSGAAVLMSTVTRAGAKVSRA